MTTKLQQTQLAAQPFDFDKLIEFCGTKRLATRLGTDMGDALLEAKRQEDRNEACSDTTFELMFWDGKLYLDEDDLYEYFADQHYSEPVNEIEDYAHATAYCDILDATIALCEDRSNGRKFIAVRYEFKDRCYQHTAWWLS